MVSGQVVGVLSLGRVVLQPGTEQTAAFWQAVLGAQAAGEAAVEAAGTTAVAAEGLAGSRKVAVEAAVSVTAVVDPNGLAVHGRLVGEPSCLTTQGLMGQ